MLEAFLYATKGQKRFHLVLKVFYFIGMPLNKKLSIEKMNVRINRHNQYVFLFPERCQVKLENKTNLFF